jgi:hypothetical protein
VSYAGELVGGIRCSVTRTKKYHAKNEKAPAAPAPKGKTSFDDLTDDVPF